jgi:hypothetical protein
MQIIVSSVRPFYIIPHGQLQKNPLGIALVRKMPNIAYSLLFEPFSVCRSS